MALRSGWGLLLERIADRLDQVLIDGDGVINKLIYRDRYLNSPLPGMLLISSTAKPMA